jgi:hypothetical protein
MERKYDPCGPLRSVLLTKLNHQRRLAIGPLAVLFGDRTDLRKAVAERWSELADYVTFATPDELHRLTRSLHLWRLNSPLSMPSLDDLRRKTEVVEYSRN